MKSAICIGIGCALALASCQKNDEMKRDEGTDRSIIVDTQSAKPATDLGQADPSGPTALDQGESEADRNITRQVRQALINHDKLSTEAQNAQVITRNGVVTLRGEVENASEKALLAELAQGAPGVTRIDNQLAVDAD